MSISNKKRIICSDGSEFVYDKLCVCLGAQPRTIAAANPHVVVVRDTETVADLQRRVAACRRVAVVGNGGIATELVYEIENCHVHWIIKDDHLSHIFFDAHAAKFFETRLNVERKRVRSETSEASIRKKYSLSSTINRFIYLYSLQNIIHSFLFSYVCFLGLIV